MLPIRRLATVFALAGVASFAGGRLFAELAVPVLLQYLYLALAIAVAVLLTVPAVIRARNDGASR